MRGRNKYEAGQRDAPGSVRRGRGASCDRDWTRPGAGRGCLPELQRNQVPGGEGGRGGVGTGVVDDRARAKSKDDRLPINAGHRGPAHSPGPFSDPPLGNTITGSSPVACALIAFAPAAKNSIVDVAPPCLSSSCGSTLSAQGPTTTAGDKMGDAHAQDTHAPPWQADSRSSCAQVPVQDELSRPPRCRSRHSQPGDLSRLSILTGSPPSLGGGPAPCQSLRPARAPSSASALYALSSP